mmetsp:Transcript_81792/g.100331  ORF Transcript_81792/g.100331 Transcript_81792/m.100331 type:complete len:279 (+) Transcript_81792:78-914(+)
MEAPPNTNIYVADLPAGIDVNTVQTIFSEYGTIVSGNIKVMPGNAPGRKSAAMIRFSTLDEAKWIKENLDGNIPQGLSEAVIVRYADTPEIKAAKAMGMAGGGGGMGKGGWGMNGGGKGGYGKSKGGGPQRSMPYMAPAALMMGMAGGKGKVSVGGMKGGGKGQWGGIKGLFTGLLEAKALPGAAEMDNDRNALYVSGLPSDTQDVDLYRIFAPFGAIAPKGVKAMQNPDGSCQGWGFVNYLDSVSVSAASDMLNGTQQADGRELIVKAKAAKDAKKV